MNEREIIAGCSHGEPESFRRMVEAFGPLVLATTINILGNKEDAEDVCQETFVRVFRNFDRYDPRRSFKTWLLTIAYRRAFDMIRKKRRFREFAARARHEPAVTSGGCAMTPGGSARLPSRFLAGLTPNERAALLLWANEGYLARDISEVLGCSESTARVHLFNARRKIKAVLEGTDGILQNG